MEHKSESSGSQDHPETATQQQYILDPHLYLQWCTQDKKIKVMDECNPIFTHIYLKDISLHKKGPLEDKIYSKMDKYYWNIRRGNTLCQIYDQNQKETDLFMCRRGMKKFYDLEPQYLKLNRSITYKQERCRKRIFQKLDMVFNQGTKVHLYSIFKQNGEHCQISYLDKASCWLFASKNVAILAKTETDLEDYYHKQRFYWAKLIGKQFFKILSKFTLQQTDDFKKDIAGKTLLGEHCGYEQHQHITRYSQIEIIFYALVENNGTDHCLPVRDCQQFLAKYGLKMSKIMSIQNLLNKHEVYESMYKMLKDVAEGKMQEYGEGSVMYIVSQNKEKEQKTIGMCKLKTCEYLIFRRIREMLKIFFAKKGETANSFQKFKFDIERMCESYFKPPKPIEYYFRIAKEAFSQVKNNQKDFTESEFRYKFVNFLQNVIKQTEEQASKEEDLLVDKKRIILITLPLTTEETTSISALCKKFKAKPQFAYRSTPNEILSTNVISILHMVPRINETFNDHTHIIINNSSNEKIVQIAKQLEKQQDLKKSHLISFLKSPDKVKSLTLLSEKITSYGQALKEKQIEHKIVNQLDELLLTIENRFKARREKENTCNREEQNFQEEVKNLKVIMTMSIPGSGKTSLAEKLSEVCEEKGINFKILSSDKIRKKVMEKFQRKNQGMSKQHIYNQTKKQGLSAYRQALEEQLSQTIEPKIVFIDRVFCPTTIFENIQEMNRKHIQFIILTQTQTQTKLNESFYPLSLDHLLICLKRSLEREQHETLSDKPAEIVRVILKFYQMYRDYRFNKLSKMLKEAEISGKIIGINFTEENQTEVTNSFLRKKVEECLKQISPGHEPPPSELYSQLIQFIYKYSDHIQKKSQSNEKEQEKVINQNSNRVLEALGFK